MSENGGWRIKLKHIAIVIRMDWFDPQQAALVELKTTASLDGFQMDCASLGNHSQLAFHRSVLAADLRCEPTEISGQIIAVEKRAEAGIRQQSSIEQSRPKGLAV